MFILHPVSIKQEPFVALGHLLVSMVLHYVPFPASTYSAFLGVHARMTPTGPSSHSLEAYFLSKTPCFMEINMGSFSWLPNLHWTLRVLLLYPAADSSHISYPQRV